MARPIVIGTITDGPTGLKIVNYWARVPITAPARQAYYAKAQAGLTPSAPGDYSGADAQEVTDFRAGLFRECPLFDVVLPSNTQAQNLARLVGFQSAVATNATADDNGLLAYYDSYYDGTSWHANSA